MFWALSPCSTMLKQSLKSITSALCLESFSGVLSNHQVNIWCVESGPLVLNCPNIHQNREVSVRCLEFISRTSIKRQSRCPIFWVGPLATTSKPEMYQGLDSAKNTSLYPGSSEYSLYLPLRDSKVFLNLQKFFFMEALSILLSAIFKRQKKPAMEQSLESAQN